jgi:hypothetical protein
MSGKSATESGLVAPPDLLDSEAKTPQQQDSRNRAFRVSRIDTRRTLLDT